MDEEESLDVGAVSASEGDATGQGSEQSVEPSSMLEAIQDGLRGDEPEEVAGKSGETENEKGLEENTEGDAATENEDEPPEGISKKAQERFRNLTHRLKEKDTELASVRQDLDGIRTIMRDTGAKAEDFGLMFDYMRALNKGDMDYVGKVLAEQIRQYTLQTGKQIGAVDPLSQFPDLRQRVDSYQMDEQAALELARQRSFQQDQQRQSQENDRRQQSQNQFQQVKQSAMAEVDRMGSEWAKRDPDYKAKEEIILKQIPAIAKNFHPSQWPQQVEILYQTLSAMPIAKQAPSPQPLRSSGQAGGTKQPGSMLEALKTGLGYSA